MVWVRPCSQNLTDETGNENAQGMRQEEGGELCAAPKEKTFGLARVSVSFVLLFS